MPRVLGLMSGSSLDGLDIACVDFSSVAAASSSSGDKWTFDIVHAETMPYSPDWVNKLSTATELDARSYLLLHSAYGHYLGQCVTRFLARYDLPAESIDVVTSHGHTVFHEPWNGMTAQLGDGAAISAETRLKVVSDLRAMDVAFGGQGAPIVPIGEKYLFENYRLLLNIGGIANLSDQTNRIAFDICPANRIMNKLMQTFCQQEFDENGQLASKGEINEVLLGKLNQFDYYKKTYPKSLSNAFGLDLVYPLIVSEKLSVQDSLRTYVEHIVQQISRSIEMIIEREKQDRDAYRTCQMLVTGGGAHNQFLIERLRAQLKADFGIEVECPETKVIDFKEALIMAFIGLLRVENKPNALASVTGARMDSVGGALWTQ